jgi:hypothetical protein
MEIVAPNREKERARAGQPGEIGSIRERCHVKQRGMRCMIEMVLASIRMSVRQRDVTARSDT